MAISRSKKLKICFVVPYAYSLFNKETSYVFGGSEVRAWLLSTGLARLANFEVSFVVFNHGQKFKEYYDGVTVYADAYFGLVSENTQPQVSQRSKRIKNIIQRIKSKLFPSPCIHIDSYSVPEEKFSTYSLINADLYCTFGVANFSAELIAFTKKYDKKSLLFIGSGGDIKAEYLSDPYGHNEYGSLHSLCAFSLEQADNIVCQGIEQKEALSTLFGRHSLVIKNPINLDLGVTRIENDNRKEVLWIGKSDHIKRPYLFVELAQRNPDITFIMIMNKSNPELHAETLAQAPENLKIIEYVHFNNVESYFAEAYIFVSTSKFEGFHNTFLQAGKYGLPIFSLTVNPDNFITEYDCGVFANDNYEVLLMEISEVFSDNKAYELKSTNCYSYFKDNHDLDRIVKEIELVIRQLK